MNRPSLGPRPWMTFSQVLVIKAQGFFFVFVARGEMDPWSFLLQLESGRRRMGNTGMGNAPGPWCPLQQGSSEPKED